MCSLLGIAMRHRHLNLLARMLIQAARMQPMLHARPVMLSLAQRGKQSCEQTAATAITHVAARVRDPTLSHSWSAWFARCQLPEL